MADVITDILKLVKSSDDSTDKGKLARDFSENMQKIDDFAGKQAYVHTQSTPSATWTINHNLGRNPSVTVVDSSEKVVFGDITYVTDNQLTVSFSAAFGGKAYLN